MPVGFYKSYESSDPQKFKISKGNQYLGIQETPFYSRLQVITPDTSLQGAATAGVKWAFTIIPEAANENAHLEGSIPAASEYWNATHTSNHFQIFKKTYGVSGSAIKDSLEGLDRQKTLALIAFRKDINKALIKNDKAIQRSDSVPGKLGGLYSIFGVHNEIDAAGKELTYDMLEDALGLADVKGLNLDTCYANGRQLRNLNKILQENKRGVMGDNALIGQNYNKITNLANTTKDVSIIKENMFEPNELILLLQENFALVHFREEDLELPRVKDAIERQVLMELSFWYDNPYSAVRIKNLKVD